MTDDLYELLQVSPAADTEVIAAAWRKLAAKAHPDAGGDAEWFQELEAAYATLSDPLKRADYDRERRSAQRSMANEPNGSMSPQTSSPAFAPAWSPSSQPLPTTGGPVARLSRAMTRIAVFLSLAPLPAVLAITAIGGAAVGWLTSELATFTPPASLFRLVVTLAVAWASSGVGGALARKHSPDKWLWAVRGYSVILVAAVVLNLVSALAALIPVVLILAIAFFAVRHRIRRGRATKGAQS